jgi:hypothetical protein
MKIQIVKNGNIKVKPMALCPFLVDIPPEASKKN